MWCWFLFSHISFHSIIVLILLLSLTWSIHPWCPPGYDSNSAFIISSISSMISKYIQWPTVIMCLSYLYSSSLIFLSCLSYGCSYKQCYLKRTFNELSLNSLVRFTISTPTVPISSNVYLAASTTYVKSIVSQWRLHRWVSMREGDVSSNLVHGPQPINETIYIGWMVLPLDSIFVRRSRQHVLWYQLHAFTRKSL